MPKATFQTFLDARYPGVGDFNEATSTALGAGVEMEAAYDEGILKGYMMAAEEKMRSERDGGGGSEKKRSSSGGGDAGFDKGLQDGWSEAVRASGGRADVPMAKSGTSGPEYRKGHLQGYKDAAGEKKRGERSGGSGPKVKKRRRY
jgi:hypothetical protein